MRVQFSNPSEFLNEAASLIREDRVVWRKGHQMAHIIEKFEAEFAILYASPAKVKLDPDWDGRYRIPGTTRSGMKFMTVASVMEVEGEGRFLFIASAFEPWRRR